MFRFSALRNPFSHSIRQSVLAVFKASFFRTGYWWEEARRLGPENPQMTIIRSFP